MPGPAEMPPPAGLRDPVPAGGPGQDSRERAPLAGRDARRNWADLRTRVLSALVLGPLALLCIWRGGAPWDALVMLAAAGMGWEWAALCGAPPARVPGGLVPGFAGAAALSAALWGGRDGMLALAAGVVVTLFAASFGAAVRRRATLAAGIPYVGLGAVALVVLRADPGTGLGNVLFVILVVWASDIGAYAVGRMVGGPKLAPSISPGKTRSGAVGGLLAAMLVGVLVGAVAGRAAGAWWLHAGLAAALLGIAAQAGDLLESWAKRRFGVKDSGRLIPGHGGLLDRLDGVLAAAPVAAALSLWFGRGVHLWG